MDGNAFSTKLRAVRLEKGLRQSDVANLFGWTPQYYARYEKGQLLPTKYNYKRFSSFMGISEKELIDLLDLS